MSTVTVVPIKEVDMVNDESAKKLLYQLSGIPHGIYSAEDPAQLEVQGSSNDAEAKVIFL